MADCTAMLGMRWGCLLLFYFWPKAEPWWCRDATIFPQLTHSGEKANLKFDASNLIRDFEVTSRTPGFKLLMWPSPALTTFSSG